MSGRDDIEAILARFRQWIDAARTQVDGHDSEHEVGSAGIVDSRGDLVPTAPLRDFGIIDLVEEFTALRHEVKLQTKSGRGLFEQTEASMAALHEAIEQFRSVEPKEDQAVWTAGKALVEALADLDEALDRGSREIERARRQIADESIRALEKALNDLHTERSWIRRRFLRAYHTQVLEVVNRDSQSRHEFFASFLEGFGLIQKRLRRVMAAERIERIVCENTPVDPELMTVLEVVERADQRPGTVVKELRPGYTWRGRVVRYAEVQAVRGSPAESIHSAEVVDDEIDDERDNASINDGFASQ